MKALNTYFAVIIIMCLFSATTSASEVAPPVKQKDTAVVEEICAKPLLASFTAITEERLEGVLRELKLLSSLQETRSGKWNRMKGLLKNFAASDIKATAVWFARPDGSYYTVEKDLTDQNLRDRPYFSRLIAGNDVVGDLIIGKTSGKKSVVVATPVKIDGKVIGALGASLSLAEMSRTIDEKMRLPNDTIFYAMDAQGRTALHRVTSRLFAFPSDMGSTTLRNTVQEMLAKQQGSLSYEFHGQKSVVFSKSRLTGWVFVLGFLKGGDAGKSENQLPFLLSELEQDIAAVFRKMDANLADAAKGLSETGLTGNGARQVLRSLCRSNPAGVDCTAVDRKGKMVTVEPKEYHAFEGTEIGDQEQVRRVQELNRPVMSTAFRSVEGFDAVDFEYPIVASSGEFIGSASLLFRPESLLERMIRPFSQGLPVDVWVMQTDGRILYDHNVQEIGRMLFTDPMYTAFPQLIALGKDIAETRSGSGSYQFPGKDMKKPVTKDAYWTTVGLHGTEWRLVLTHTEAEDGTFAARVPSEERTASYEKALRDFAGDSTLKDALANRAIEQIQRLFEKFYLDHSGIYAIQWLDASGINRYGFPEENSLISVDLNLRKTPSSSVMVKALAEKTETAFDSPLAEGKEGHFVMTPVFAGSRYLGMVYLIRINP